MAINTQYNVFEGLIGDILNLSNPTGKLTQQVNALYNQNTLYTTEIFSNPVGVISSAVGQAEKNILQPLTIPLLIIGAVVIVYLFKK